MSKKHRINNRKSSALLAAGTGALVCLTSSGVAHAVNGLVAASNGTSVFGPSTGLLTSPVQFNLFSSKVSVTLATYPAYTSLGARLFIGPGTAAFDTFTYYFLPVIAPFPAGWVIDSALSYYFNSLGGFVPYQTQKYFAVRFPDSGKKYGWVHYVAHANATRQITLGVWSYNASGGSITTLSDSVSTNKLPLTDGQEKLHWSNDNEDGVARYEVQTQDAAGNWTATDSDVPGSGSYSVNVAKGATCRLVVEMTDGSLKEVDF